MERCAQTLPGDGERANAGSALRAGADAGNQRGSAAFGSISDLPFRSGGGLKRPWQVGYRFGHQAFATPSLTGREVALRFVSPLGSDRGPRRSALRRQGGEQVS